MPQLVSCYDVVNVKILPGGNSKIVDKADKLGTFLESIKNSVTVGKKYRKCDKINSFVK
ncbi:MAG: hypothetical protein Q4D45_03270 [Lachnospiraceae bacterium]|nr:hypothetical protein [Lachnospiraceae bacterium]